MAQEIDTAELDAWRTFLKAHAAAVGAIEGELAAAGAVPLVDYDVLVALAHAPGRRLRLRELTAGLVLTRSGITRLIDRLEREGLLQRERCGNDRRGVYAVLTEAGMDAMRQAWPVYARGIREHFARNLAGEEMAVLAAALGKVAGGADGS